MLSDDDKVVSLFKLAPDQDSSDNLPEALRILMRKYGVRGYVAAFVIDKSAYVSIETLGEDQWATAGHLIASCQSIIQRLADTK